MKQLNLNQSDNEIQSEYQTMINILKLFGIILFIAGILIGSFIHHRVLEKSENYAVEINNK